MANPTYIEDYEIFPYPPLVELEEMLENVTNILTAQDGSEQRISIRPAPRQSFKFKAFIEGKGVQSKLDALIFGWQKLFWGLPIWPEKEEHTDTITAGANSITMDTAYADYREDTLAIIWKSPTEFETVLISTVNDNSLGLADSVVNTYTGAKLIMPCRLAQLISPVKTLQASYSQSIREFNFLVVDNILLTDHTADTEYTAVDSGSETLEVITIPGIIGRAEREISLGDLSVQDYLTGEFKYFSDSDYNIITRQYHRRFTTKAACWNHRLWLHSLYGRQVANWLPTFKDDLQFNETIEASDTVIQVDDIELTANMGLNDLRTQLAFIFSDGTDPIFREIEDISENTAGYDEITISSALGVEVAVGGCIISYLDKCRRLSDQAKLKWITSNECESKLNFVVVTE